jgi:threonine/homoserine/homoserine lactone efflux protein
MLAFCLTALLIEMTPGPNMAYLATVALVHGRRPALLAVAGVALGLALSGLAVVLGLAAVAQSFPILFVVLRYAGIGYLLWLAYDTWTEPADDGAKELASFGRGLITNLLNPKAFVFYISVMPGFLPQGAGSGLGISAAYVAVYVAIATAVHATIVFGADALRPVLQAAGPRQRVRHILAFGFVAVALWFAWSTRIPSSG